MTCHPLVLSPNVMNRFSPLSALAVAGLLPAQFFQTANGAPPPSAPEQVVFDEVRDRMVARIDNQTWERDAFDWHLVATAHSPGLRYEFAMCYDGARVLLYGGQSGSVAGSDLWAYDGVDWQQLSVGTGPGPRRAAALAFDPLRQRLVLFGGTDMLGGFPADTWEWDGVSWQQVAIQGPASRVWHRMVYDEARQRVVMCGGALNPTYYFDTWEWDGVAWQQTVFGQYPNSSLGGLVYDRSTQRTLSIGGIDIAAGPPRNEVHAYDAVAGTWSLVVTTPFLQQNLGAAYDPTRQRTLVVTGDPSFGAVDSNFYRDQGAAIATFVPYGAGCAGAAGVVPSLAGQGGSVPTLGTTFVAAVTPVAPAAAAVLAVGWSARRWGAVSLPLDLGGIGLTGCSLQASAEVLATMAPGAGSASVSWALPNLPALRGAVFFMQALVLDPAAPNGLGAVSNGAFGVLQ